MMQSRDALLGSIGEFDKKDKISKLMARQGQSMSASTYVADVTEKQVKLIHDKESEFDKSILFSDGCGYISQDLL